ncbi:aminotransferase class III-fold pyridoxal phosphate-dependent enzyme [Ensifer psoraleae]|uniref:Aminotransferase class III-fold pyridoxal phosphate-dependent enzyme n=1 Tax=Sinorhizobium psoraleae TaxID=520838 RepID=A0ABT4KS45_9HYPH|nr:aminotransferase class III-fold pyridoxal phosphate-dependent enzyme [Sinorhizobium psoraleae]MCZ4093732.1 aminotransferase class III-fold pyridoxal phosphate-dependent enzyme [Sinorhizobium psoraleae]
MVADLAGPGLDQTFPGFPGGSEAIEATLKLARQYAVVSGQPARSKILARMPGYHGSTMGAAAVTGDLTATRCLADDADNAKDPAPLSYRLLEGFDVNSYADYCANELERQISREGEDTVLAFIMEPVGGVATGALVAPDHYYKTVRGSVIVMVFY